LNLFSVAAHYINAFRAAYAGSGVHLYPILHQILNLSSSTCYNLL